MIRSVGVESCLLAYSAILLRIAPVIFDLCLLNWIGCDFFSRFLPCHWFCSVGVEF